MKSNRRTFLVQIGGGAAALAASTIALGPLVEKASASSAANPVPNGVQRAQQAYRLRRQAALAEFQVPIPQQVSNGDEQRYSNFIGNFSKTLPHNAIGEVDLSAYKSLLTAVNSGDPSDFALIPLGGTAQKLAGPQAGLAFTLEGTDSGQVTIPPAPALNSAERACEMVEDYWMALRDVPFSQYESNSTVLAAAAELNNLADFTGPRDANGQVTPDTLFRGMLPKAPEVTGAAAHPDLIGPYISQFLLQDVNLGALGVSNAIPQKYQSRPSDTDYMTDFASWLRCQNGQTSSKPGPGPLTYIKNGRDLAAYDHSDFPAQASLMAALWLIKHVRFNPANPYLTSTNQGGGITWGANRVPPLLYQLSSLAAKAVFYQKWFVHRTLRPEAYGGLVHNTITGVAKYDLHPNVLNSDAVSRVFIRYGTYLLPMADIEGCPAHPSYAAAHAVTAGASITALKAFFDENVPIGNPQIASPDGQSLLPYVGPGAGEMTVGSELNKLASNISLGRNIEGVHWRSDAVQGLLLGEAVAISILQDQRSMFNEPFTNLPDGKSGYAQFTKFDGTPVTI
jgi:hypothetical protein